MRIVLGLAHWAFVLLMPILMIGVINRVKSWWAARKGPGLVQFAYDLRRLLGKRTVVSDTATPLFRAGAYVVLLAGFFAAAMAPMLGRFAPLQFSHDFIVVAYTMGLARIALMLSAMDVGSSFEGMGTAREASFSAFAEPALFLLIGTAGVATGMTSFADLIGALRETQHYAVIAAPLVVALLILLQAEAARVPVDDPLTHLELTMIHEAMLLEYSGRYLGLMMWAAQVKQLVVLNLFISLFFPWGIAGGLAEAGIAGAVLLYLLKLALLSAILAVVETLYAKVRLFKVPPLLSSSMALSVLVIILRIVM